MGLDGLCMVCDSFCTYVSADLCKYVVNSGLCVAADLDLFKILKGSPKSAKELAKATGADALLIGISAHLHVHMNQRVDFIQSELCVGSNAQELSRLLVMKPTNLQPCQTSSASQLLAPASSTSKDSVRPLFHY